MGRVETRGRAGNTDAREASEFANSPSSLLKTSRALRITRAALLLDLCNLQELALKSFTLGDNNDVSSWRARESNPGLP